MKASARGRPCTQIMKPLHWSDQTIALFMADSADVHARLDALNQKLWEVLETLPNTPDTSQKNEQSKNRSMVQNSLEDFTHNR